MSEEAKKIMEWLMSDDTGLSSVSICAHMTGAKTMQGRRYPSDPSDLGRCLRLLERFPEWESRINEMAVYGTGWIGLVKHWDKISAMMKEEVGINWEKGRNAPKTYKAMQLAIADGYRADKNYQCTFYKNKTLCSAKRITKGDL